MPQHVSTIAIDLLGKLLNKIPDKRLGVNSMDDIKSHLFFKGLDWNKLSLKQMPIDGIFPISDHDKSKLLEDSMNYEEEQMYYTKHRVDFHDEDYRDSGIFIL